MIGLQGFSFYVLSVICTIQWSAAQYTVRQTIVSEYCAALVSSSLLRQTTFPWIEKHL